MAEMELQMNPQMEQIHGEIRDTMRALANGFQKLDKVKDSNRQSKQLKDLTGKSPTDKVISIGLSWQPKIPFLTSSSSKNESSASKSSAESSSLYKKNSLLIDSLFVPPNNPIYLNKLFKKQIKDNAGSTWFGMPAQTITPELEKDLQLLKLRNVVDPKRHYKKGDSKSKTLPKYFQIGTVIESATEFYTGRLTKKERKASLADELLSDRTLGDYRRRKVREIEEVKCPAGLDKWKNSKIGKWKKKKRKH